MKKLLLASFAGLTLIAGGVFLASGPGNAGSSATAPTQQANANLKTVTLDVENMYCASCPYIVKKSLAAVNGVTDVSVSYENKTATVTFDGTQTDVAALTDATFEAGYPSELKE